MQPLFGKPCYNYVWKILGVYCGKINREFVSSNVSTKLEIFLYFVIENRFLSIVKLRTQYAAHEVLENLCGILLMRVIYGFISAFFDIFDKPPFFYFLFYLGISIENIHNSQGSRGRLPFWLHYICVSNWFFQKQPPKVFYKKKCS